MNHNDDMDALAESLRRYVQEHFDGDYYGRRIYAGTNLDHIQGWRLDEVEREILELDPLKPLQCRGANKRVNQQIDGSALDDFFNEFVTE